ncbi:MAG TPA: hypothetical protein PLP17_01810 [Oligoflexia bacterium]|mgnify:CR=1 FL=1|nr:hypothetical protein [Oligoflexia bacterium]
MSDERQNLERLNYLVGEALAVPEDGSLDEFVAKTEGYMEALEAWQAEIGQSGLSNQTSELPEHEKSMLRELISSLNERHQQLMVRAGMAKDNVGAAMGDIHRRAAGLKKYVDSYPSRITIAGKRKG